MHCFLVALETAAGLGNALCGRKQAVAVGGVGGGGMWKQASVSDGKVNEGEGGPKQTTFISHKCKMTRTDTCKRTDALTNTLAKKTHTRVVYSRVQADTHTHTHAGAGTNTHSRFKVTCFVFQI